MCEALINIAKGVKLTLAEFNMATNYLVRSCIPFDVSFVPGTRKYASSLQLTIHVCPTKTEVFVVNLAQGASVFSPSP